MNEEKRGPLSDDEIEAFRRYAEANNTEPDGSESQWANYTLRCLEQLSRLKLHARNLERYSAEDAQRLAKLQAERDALSAKVGRLNQLLVKAIDLHDPISLSLESALPAGVTSRERPL